MADRKHWAPMSHDINRDPEVWELTDTFGDRMLRVWLEILSVGDRNQGELKGTLDEWAKTLNRMIYSKNPRWVRSDLEKVKSAIRWMSEKGWIEIRDGSEPSLRVVNHAKYHPTRSLASDAPTILPSEPTSSKKEEKNKTPLIVAFVLPDWIKIETWKSFEEMRRKERHPLTDRAKQLVVSQLEKFRNLGHDPNECLEISVRNGWRDVYEPKGWRRQSKVEELRERTKEALEVDLESRSFQSGLGHVIKRLPK